MSHYDNERESTYNVLTFSEHNSLEAENADLRLKISALEKRLATFESQRNKRKIEAVAMLDSYVFSVEQIKVFTNLSTKEIKDLAMNV